MKSLNSFKPVVPFPTVQEVRDPHVQKRLRWSAKNIDISSRKWPDYICDVVFGFEGKIVLASGIVWKPPFTFGDELGCGRWFRHLFELDSTGDFRRDVRDLYRLQLMLLALRIDKPQIATSIVR